MRVTCNNCLDEFELENDAVLRKALGGLDIQYFVCPSCDRPYVILAADEQMKKLIADRGAIQRKIRMAQTGNFRQKTIRKLVEEQAAIIKKQKALAGDLKLRAVQLLKEAKT